MAIRVRPLTAEEQATIERLAHSRTAPARLVERARIIWHAAHGATVPAVARQLHLHEQTVRLWLKRFNTAGLDALQDAPRAGRPATYTADEVSVVIATALTKPTELDQPFGRWTLDRLVTYLNETCHIAMKRSRIDEILLAEGLQWRKEETWFSERVDPEFAQKRGPSTGSIPLHPKEV